MPLPTCKHLHDNGKHCNSAAAQDRDYCLYHLNYCARRLRMAQYRARCEQFNLQLPPLEDMYAVQSALSQLAEALAADMIDPKRAQALLSVLRLASLNLLHPEKWQTSLYHSDQPGPAVDLAAEYGLPADLDLDTPPELAFPPPAETNSMGAPPLSPAFGDRVGNRRLPDVGNCGNAAVVPDDLRNPHVPDNFDFTPDYPITAEYVELDEVWRTQGNEASAARSTQLTRNQGRRRLHSERKRYAKIAARINLYRAAEKLAAQKLAEQATQQTLASQSAEDASTKKPPISAACDTIAKKKEDAIA
jgi:hypothetical protein